MPREPVLDDLLRVLFSPVVEKPMSDFRPVLNLRPLLTALVLVGVGLGASALLVSSQTPDPDATAGAAPELEEVQERYVQFFEADSVETPASVSPPAADGVEAPKAEAAEARQRESLSKKSAVLRMSAEMGMVGGQDAGEGLGSRGSSLGGGGTAAGLDGLGTRGRASGGGYGSGSASFGITGSRGQVHGAIHGALEGRVARPMDRGPSSSRSHATGATEYSVKGADPSASSRRSLTSTAVDATSTFAADVDTGSYTYARRMLRSGVLPMPDTVRVEEFVNFFRYDYGQPEPDSPLGVTSQLVPHPEASDRHLLTIGVQAKTVENVDRKPVRLTFLVDTSGSMRGADRLVLAQRAMKHSLLGLGAEDTVAIVTYSGQTRVALSPTPATRRGQIRAAIDGLRSGGGTAMDSGMTLAYQQAEASYAEGAENRVIVLSDGDANIGRTGAEDMLKTIRRHAEGGITLTTMGFGTGNYQDARMERLADAGDGVYMYVDSWAEAERIFGAELGSTLETVGRDVKLQVELDPSRVKAWRQVGYVNRQLADEDFRDDAVDAGEVGSGHQVTALYELELRSGARSVGDLHLRIKPPGPDRPAREWTTSLPHLSSGRPSADTRVALAAMNLADGLHGRDADALQRALEEAERLQTDGREGSRELVELCRLALELVREEERVAVR